MLLPSSVVAALCRVRDAEHASNMWTPWIAYLEQQDSPQRLPDPLERVSHIERETDDNQRPTVEELEEEINTVLQESVEEKLISSIAFAGEGEPTLRLGSLLTVARRIHNTYPTVPLRLVTNGLIPKNDRSNVPERLADVGVTQISVALMTHQPALFDELMRPLNEDGEPVTLAHARVCNFIQSGATLGLRVEATGVDRPGVDKEKTEALAKQLGAQSFRWRTYFP